jgi:hypothetical protein
MTWSLWSSSPSDDASDAATIDDKSWRKLQGRAAKANPKLRDTFGKEATADRRRGQDNYKNRKQN